MGGPTKEVVATGGGPAKPLASDLTRALQALIAGEGTPEGSLFGRLTQRDPFGITQNIIQGIEGLDAPASMGQALQQIIQRDVDRQVADLRARFGAAGGTSLGTPGAVGEALFRSEAAPRFTTALGQLGLQQRGLELQGLLPLLQIAAQLGGFGIPQAREDVLVGPSKFSQVTGGIGDILSGIGEIVPG